MRIAALRPDQPDPSGMDYRISIFEGDLGALSKSTASGYAGLSITSQFLSWAGRSPATRAWDFTALALGVIGADRIVNRLETSPDGWTRQLELTVGVSDPALWQSMARDVEEMLSFLTGDFWTLNFIEGGYHPAPPKKLVGSRPETCVALLSGGLDSLIGAIDMETNGLERPVYVSNRVRGDRVKQETFAAEVGAGKRLLALNAFPRTTGVSPEISQRPRSLIFIAFAVLAATLLDKYLDGDEVDLHTPENGFISLNTPLTTMRRGSLSTRTTHPKFISMLQEIFTKLGIRVRLQNHYQLQTKGKMMQNCADQALLAKLAHKSMSCGRAGRTLTHCGRCLPCLVRRAAFLKWTGRLDGDQTRYIHPDVQLKVDGKINNEFHGKAFAEYDDVMQALTALNFVKRNGARRWIGPTINEASFGLDAPAYRTVAEEGLLEIGEFLELTGLR